MTHQRGSTDWSLNRLSTPLREKENILTLPKPYPKESQPSKDTDLTKNRDPRDVNKGMSFYCYKKFDFGNCFFEFEVSDVRECHRLICHYINSLLNVKFFHYYIFDNEIRRHFKNLCFSLKTLIRRYSKKQFHKKELYRFWKVKRVQIAKIISDFECSKLCARQVKEKIQAVFDNAFIYSLKNKKYSYLHYAFTLLFKTMYNLIFTDKALKIIHEQEEWTYGIMLKDHQRNISSKSSL